MKKILFMILALLAVVRLDAQPGIRSNYRNKGNVHISSDYALVRTSDNDPRPMWEKLEYVKFQDGGEAYILYLNFEEKTSVDIPKGVKMAVTLSDGKLVRSEQIYSRTGAKRAFTSSKGRVYWNRAKYLLTPADIHKMAAGVKSIDIITGWNPEDYFQINYSTDILGKTIAAQLKTIESAKKHTVELRENGIDRYADSYNSLSVFSKPIVARGANRIYNVSLTYLYYKNSNKEDVDLMFQIGTEKQEVLHYGQPLSFTLGNGKVISLIQTRDDYNKVCCYPTLDQVKEMIAGDVKSVTYTTEQGSVTDTFSNGSFSKALAGGFQSLMSVAAM